MSQYTPNNPNITSEYTEQPRWSKPSACFLKVVCRSDHKKNILLILSCRFAQSLLVSWHSLHLTSSPTNRLRCKYAADYTQTDPTHQDPIKTFALDFSHHTGASAERWQTEVCSLTYCLPTIIAVISTRAPVVLIICLKGLLTGCTLFKIIALWAQHPVCHKTNILYFLLRTKKVLARVRRYNICNICLGIVSQ